MKIEDFAVKKRSYGQTAYGSTLAWEITDVDCLERYLKESGYKPSELAKKLSVPYSKVKRWLVFANIWDKAIIKNKSNKGGRKKTTTHDKFGYEYAPAEHDYYDSYGNKCRKYLHHVVCEKRLGRSLLPNECVHHINLDKSDNRPENLFVCNNKNHRTIHQDLEHLAGRLMESGVIDFVPELEKYIYVGGHQQIKKELPDGKGFVVVEDVLGTDATIVNAARVSFGKSICQIREQDKHLLNYLAKHGHTSPFRHVYVQFHIKAPEFVARQWYKHIVGSEYSFKDMPWNEISGRYVEYDLESFIPKKLRAQSKDSKQGSSDEEIVSDELMVLFEKHVSDSFSLYNKMLSAGVAKEQARTILPLTFYTEWYWTASLQAIAHFVSLRSSSSAQIEIREYANMIEDCMVFLFPNAWKAIVEAGHKK